MSALLELTYLGQESQFRTEPLERRHLLGDTRLLALDAEGRECRIAHLTKDGIHLILPGATADSYVDQDGNWVDRSSITRNGATPSQTKRTTGPVEMEGPVPAQDLLDCVATRVHCLDAETLHPALAAGLKEGAVFQLKDATADAKSFLLANDAGTFLIQTEPCGFEFVGPEQLVKEPEFSEDGEASDPFAFSDTGEMQP